MTGRLAAYREHFLTGDWQCHSTFSDGRDAPAEMVEAAVSIGLPLLALTDHVTRASDWLDGYLVEVARLKRAYAGRILLLAGVEAKVVDLGGRLDLPPGCRERVDVVLGSFHRIPTPDGFLPREEIARRPDEARGWWFEAVCAMLAGEEADVYAHPTGLLKVHGVPVERRHKQEIARLARQHHKVVEVNAKYGVPDAEFQEILRREGVGLNRGSDAHGTDDLRRLNAVPLDQVGR